jgi:hypothetical protein
VVLKPGTDAMQEFEIKKAQEPEAKQSPWPIHEPQITYEEPKIKNKPQGDTDSVKDLLDYNDSPDTLPTGSKSYRLTTRQQRENHGTLTPEIMMHLVAIIVHNTS